MTDHYPDRNDGILIVNKPAGMSSARVVASVKKILNVKKAGHTGTLDPFATGVMVCGVNKGTRLSRFILHDKKQYVAKIRLGAETDTLDCTGQIIQSVAPELIRSDNPDLAIDNITDTVLGFQGDQMQTPPVYSALKHNGVPLYKLARQGKPVQKPPRHITIYDIRILDVTLPFIDIEVTCSAGTYIRVIASDIGRQLGVGAHLEALQRTWCSGYGVADSYSLEALNAMASPQDAMIPMADALPDMPEIKAATAIVTKICHGQTLEPTDFADPASFGPGTPFLKIVDEQEVLKAIVAYEKNKINYCCVFNS